MGERQYERQYTRRDFVGKLGLATSLGCLYGCTGPSPNKDETPKSTRRQVGTELYLIQGYDRNGQMVPADLDRNDVPELAEVNLDKKTLVRILWGDYLNPGEQNPGRNVNFNKVKEGVRIRFAAQQIICDSPVYVQPAVVCEPVVSSAASQRSILQQPAPPQPIENLPPVQPYQTPAQPPTPPQPQPVNVAPQPLAPPQPAQPLAQPPATAQQPYQAPDFTRVPRFKVKPFGEYGYYDTKAMEARHPDSMINYSRIEQLAKEKFEQDRDCD